MKGRVLIIAGSDPSGGAGLQADIKTVTALGGYAAAAVTAITVQNTRGVSAVHAVAPDVIRDQTIAVLDDIGADAIKIGMIGEEAAALMLADVLRQRARDIPIVLDPVLVATSGDALAGRGVAAIILKKLMPIAAIATPNAEEAAALTGVQVRSEDDLARAAQALMEAGAASVLAKGGHISGDEVTDILATPDGSQIFNNPRIETTSTHGTGCTLASAVAVGLAQGLALEAAVERAIGYVREALRGAPGFGVGCGPLNHVHSIVKPRQS